MVASPNKAKNVADHPTYGDMVKAAIMNLKERKGASRQKIVKYITANYKVGSNTGKFVTAALVKGVASKKIIQTSGKGAAGSFKLPAAPAPAKKETAAKKKPVAKKAATPKKKPASKKSPAKKAPAKKAAKKSPAKKVASNKIVSKVAAKKGTPKRKGGRKSRK